MRTLLALFTFLALALAPLATPTAAMASAKPCSAGMVNEHHSHGQMPAEHDRGDHAQLCCVGLASALPAAIVTIAEPPATKPLIAVSPITKLSGIQPAAADPPPRA